MKFEIITLFPDYFALSLRQSMLGKAVEKKLFDIQIVDLRDFAVDKHRTVDDTPFGGGGGMVLKVEPLDRCLASLGFEHLADMTERDEKNRIILTSAAGKKFEQSTAIRYSLCSRLAIICGHYLGVDERIMSLYDIDEVSIGDYVLTGGEPAASVIVDAVARLIPNVLGNFESALDDSYMNQMIGTPCYTRPSDYKNIAVPSPLMSGDHKRIRQFRREEAIKKCSVNRPDLLEQAELSSEEEKLLAEFSAKKNEK